MINFESRRPEPLRRLAHKAAEIIPMSWIHPAALMRVDRGMFRLSRGRTTFSALASGLPIVMLTTTGARTGELRTLPVLALPVDDHLILIASNYGRPSNPGWYYNLRAQPYVTIIWRGSSVPMHARELTGDERQRYLDLGFEAYPWWQPVPPTCCAAATAGDHARAALRSRRPMILAPVRLTWPHVLVSTATDPLGRLRCRVHLAV
jgi:deazaflavin-dependent oxidoreductase (nitroreductase family)